MEKVRLRLYQLTLLLTLVSLALVLISSGKQREFFYFAIYASLLGLFVERKSIATSPFSISLPILLIGVFNLCWYFTYEYSTEGVNVYNDYLTSSKKLILGGVLIFYLDRFKRYISVNVSQSYFLLASGVGFVLASSYALLQSAHGMGRVEMAINRPTASAYIYSVLSLTFVYSLYLQKKVAVYVVAVTLIIFSWIIITLTGTRSAMGLYLFLGILMTLYHYRTIHVKATIAFLVVIVVVGGIGYDHYIKPKVDQTMIEIDSFEQGNDDTSLGARFSMWRVGVENGIAHPLGQSTESRKQWTAKYVKDHPNYASSMIFMNVHLHNEFIEKYSLQGIPGTLLLLYFFSSALIQALRRRNVILLMTTSSLLLYGMTDVILLSSEAIIFFVTVFALSTFHHRN